MVKYFLLQPTTRKNSFTERSNKRISNHSSQAISSCKHHVECELDAPIGSSGKHDVNDLGLGMAVHNLEGEGTKA